MEIRVSDRVETDEPVELYDAVGWSSYTSAPAELARAVANTSFVVASRDAGLLVGLARGLSDDDPAQHALYRSVGFRRTSDLEMTRLNAYVRFDA